MPIKKTEKQDAIKKYSVLPLKVKIENLDLLILGEPISSISRSFNVSKSTVRSIRRSEDKLRSSVASMSLSVKFLRDPAIENMEVALLLSKTATQKKLPLNSKIIRTKAKCLYAHFKELGGSVGGESSDGGFQASSGWFHKFKVRQSLHFVKFAGAAPSADTAAAKRYLEEFSNVEADAEYTPTQILNTGETGTKDKCRDGFEEIESSEFQMLLESLDEYLADTDLEDK